MLGLYFAAGLLATAVSLSVTDYRTRAVSEHLLSDSTSSEGAAADVVSVAGVLGRMAREDASLPNNARARLLDAADSFRANPSLGGPAPAALDRAWRELSGGRAFAFPTDVRDIPK